MENHLLLILDFDQLTRASIGTTGPISLSQIYLLFIIININININYLLHLLLITLRWGRSVEFWIPWKVVPMCLGVSKHKGGDFYPHTLLYDSNFTLT
jgi:hypothetical protein